MIKLSYRSINVCYINFNLYIKKYVNIIRLGFPINLILGKKILNAISFVKNEDEF